MLKQRYLATRYVVVFENDKYDIRINEAIPSAINQLLKSQSAAILTAWNPRSQSFPLHENKTRNNYLRALLNNYSVLDALGQGDDAMWPAEESFCILGITKEEAEKLAVDFGQYAYVWLEQDKAASLEFSDVWNNGV
jgi:hypothetical protein